jgi:putative peptide zinc metalloprotease protein
VENTNPKFRNDLIVSRQEFEGTVYYVIKDPVTRRFFRVKELEYFIARSLDGKTPPEQIPERFQERFGIPLPLATLNAFIQRLESLGFLEGLASERELARLQQQKGTFPGNLLFIKLKGFDPDRILSRLLRRSRFLFTPYFLGSSLVLILLAALITLGSWSDLGYSFTGIFRIATIFQVWVAIFLVVLFHEFAHGLTCKYFGGDVHEMGFLLLYFQPCFYCNVSDAYLFPEKSKRLWVTFAGAYCQVLVWAVATILWRITALDTGLNSFLFVVVITSGITVLFNFNPLIKLDGYYLLADYLEIPNLRKKAFQHLSRGLKRILLGVRETSSAGITPRTRRIYLWYGTLSLLYSIVLLSFIAVKVEGFLVRHLGGAGFVLFLILVLLIIGKPTARGVAGAWRSLVGQKELLLKPGRIITYSGIVVGLVLVLVFVKAQLKVGSPCQMEALESFILRSQPDGTVTWELSRGGSEEKKAVNLLRLFANDYTSLNLSTNVKQGDRVKPGDVVAELSSPSYLSDLAQTTAALKKAEDYHQLLQKGAREEAVQQAKDNVAKTQSQLKLKEKELSRLSDLHTKSLISDQDLETAQTEVSVLSNQLKIAQNELKILQEGARPEELSMAQSEINQLQAKARFLEDQISASQIKSPISGVVTSTSSAGNLLSIANLDTMLVSIEVSEKNLDVLKLGLPVKVKIQAYPFRSFWGRVTRISQMADEQMPGGIFPVWCKIENGEGLLKPGMTGYAKVYCGKRSLASLLTRGIVRYLRVEVWSWW